MVLGPYESIATLAANMAHRHLPYYHPNLSSMEETRALMMTYIMQDGAFILRNSFSQPGKLTVTVMHGHSIKHFSLGAKNGKYMLHEQLFDSVKDLIDFYKCHDVPNEEEVMHLRLVYPINYYPCSNTSSFNDRKNVSRSQSVVAFPPPTPPSRFDHRHSIDSNMSSIRSNGSGQGAASRPIPMPRSRVSESSNGSAASLNSGAGSPLKPLHEPPLPLNPPKEKKKGGFFGKLRRNLSRDVAKSPEDKQSGQSQIPVAIPQSIVDRAPAPLPAPLPDPDNHYYSVISPEAVDRHRDLMENIRLSEPAGGSRCECGLTYEEAQMPCGWSMHLSQEPGSEGMIFFMGPNQETDWNLPMPVMLQLSADQQESLRNWMDKGKVNISRHSSSSSSGGGVSLPPDTPWQNTVGQSITYGRQATEHECSSGETVYTVPT